MWNMIPCLQSDQSECSRSFKHRITQAWLWRNRSGVNQCWKFEEYNTVTIKMYWWFHQPDLEKVKHYTLCHLHLTFEREVVETVSLFINFFLSIDLLDKDQVSSLNEKGLKAVVCRPESCYMKTKDTSSYLQVSALSIEFWIQITDLKQLPGLYKIYIVQYSNTLKLNSTFNKKNW